MLQLDACDSWFLSEMKTLQITYPTCQQKKNLRIRVNSSHIISKSNYWQTSCKS